MSQGPRITHRIDKPSPRYAQTLVLIRYTMSFEFPRFWDIPNIAQTLNILLIKFRIGTSTEAHNLCRSSVVSPRLANTDCKSKKNFRNNKKSGEKCFLLYIKIRCFEK